MVKIGGTIQSREMSEKGKIPLAFPRKAHTGTRIGSTVLYPGFNPWEWADFTQLSRLCNLMCISRGEQLIMFQKLEPVNYWLLSNNCVQRRDTQERNNYITYIDI